MARRGVNALTASSTLLLALIVALLIAPSPSTAALSPLARRATTCNGDASLCSRKYSNVTFAGAHDSFGIDSPGQSSAAANQNVSIATQLNAGTRMLQVQAHKSTNSTPMGAGIDLCHTSCGLFQGGSLEYYLGQVKSWTDSHTSDVVTLLIVNSDGLPATQFAEAFQSTGLSSRMWSPSNGNYNLSRSDWPTLGDMIDSGKTVVGFLATGADTSSVNYLLDEFVNMWETPYDQTSLPFNCSVNRIGTTVSDPNSIMYLSNQFLDADYGGLFTTPNTSALGTTNSLSNTLSTSSRCASQHNDRYPNFILTDFSTVPDYGVQRAAAQMNGVSYTAPAASSSSSGGSSTSDAIKIPVRFGVAAFAVMLTVGVLSIATL